MKGVRERKGGGGARRGLAPGVRMVIRRRREHGVQWLPRRLKMVRNRERGCVGSWRTNRLFAKELEKSGVLIVRKKRERAAPRSSLEAGNRKSNGHHYFH
jgi:hypothetical protein